MVEGDWGKLGRNLRILTRRKQSRQHCVNDINAPFKPNNNEFRRRVFSDENNNGLDDGEEVQANIYEAFFNSSMVSPGIIEGAFLWGNEMASNDVYHHWNELQHFGIRDKLVESVVQSYYHRLSLPAKPDKPEGPSQLCTTMKSSTLTTNSYDSTTVSYTWTITPTEAGIIEETGKMATIYWSDSFEGEASILVSGVNDCGVGQSSEALNVTVSVCTGINDVEDLPIEIFPNPSTGIVYVKNKKDNIYKVKIFNSSG